MLLDNKINAMRVRGVNEPAIPLVPALLQFKTLIYHQIHLARARLERQFVALRLIEAIRLYAANHEGRLPATLADIKEVSLPVCPLSGKSFEYRVEGERAFLAAPPIPRQSNSIKPLRYEITLRR